ncbi:hypothetical protein MHYP_G00225290 [Metynnis hypsauchen]
MDYLWELVREYRSFSSFLEKQTGVKGERFLSADWTGRRTVCLGAWCRAPISKLGFAPVMPVDLELKHSAEEERAGNDMEEL